jgi:hypothetical protein
MPIIHYDKFHKVNTKSCYGGKVPEQTSLEHMRKTFLCGCNYRRSGNIFFANDPNPKSGELTGPQGDYYIPYPSTNVGGDNGTIGMALSVQCWSTQYISNPLVHLWDGTSGKGYTAFTTGEKDIYSAPNGPGFYFYRRVPVIQNSFGPFSWSEYYIDAEVASISAYTVPETTSSIRGYGDDIHGRDVNYNLKEDIFNINQPLRGINDRQDTNGSIGTIIQQIDRGNFSDSLYHHTRQCLFSWGHRSGNYIVGLTGSTFQYRPIFGSHVVNSVTYNVEVPVVPRALKNQNHYIDMAVIGEWDSGTAIRVTTSVGTYTLNNTSTASTVTGAHLSNTILVNQNGDNLLIEAYVNDVSAINIRSIAFWESGDMQY